MKPKVSVETTILSYLAARPSRQPVTAGRQVITRQWWETERKKYNLVVSEVVEAECGRGDTESASRRRELLVEVSLFPGNRVFGGVLVALVSQQRTRQRVGSPWKEEASDASAIPNVCKAFAIFERAHQRSRKHVFCGRARSSVTPVPHPTLESDCGRNLKRVSLERRSVRELFEILSPHAHPPLR